MPHLQPDVGPPAASFVTSLIATLAVMALIFGFPETAGIGDSFSHPAGHLLAIAFVALPLLIMFGSFLWLTIALVHRPRSAR